MMTKSLEGNEAEAKRTSLIEKIDKYIKNGHQQRICPRLNNCPYVGDNIRVSNMGLSDGFVYNTMVCQQYPDLCELNREKEREQHGER